MILLWHGSEPIGICVFCLPSASVSARARFFGLKSRLRGDALAALNRQLWVLARVVLHPTYRGAGLAGPFVAAACAACPVPWIESLAVMGRANPFFERAGFRRVGICRKDSGPEPAYFVRDNRGDQTSRCKN